MIHSHYFITNKAGMPLDEFFTYWRKRHIRAVSEPVPQIRRYLQSHRIDDLEGDAPTRVPPNPGTTAWKTCSRCATPPPIP